LDFRQGNAFGLDDRTVFYQDGAFDGVGELADVPGPGVFLEHPNHFRRETLDGFLEGTTQFAQQVVGDRFDVRTAFPQRRQVDPQHVDPVVEVFAEFALAHEGLDVAVGRGDDPHVYLDRLVAAQPFEGLVLEDPQQF